MSAGSEGCGVEKRNSRARSESSINSLVSISCANHFNSSSHAEELSILGKRVLTFALM